MPGPQHERCEFRDDTGWFEPPSPSRQGLCDHGPVLNPWQWCDADDDQVADFLAATVQSVIECGGWIHPEARLTAREGDLHIACDADEGEPLARIPAAAMLPITRVDWGTGCDALNITGMRTWPQSGDLSLLLTQIGLHNACAKLPRLVTTHPSAVVNLDTDVIEAVRALRPSFRIRPMTPTEVFWATRTFRLPVVDEAAEPVAVPIIDLLDHHPNGAVGQWHDGSFTVPVRHPTGTSTCYLDYGLQRDALDVAIVYGFADTSRPFVHSGPMEIDIPSMGTVRILDQGRSASGELLPLAAHRLDDTWIVNRFTFSADPFGHVTLRDELQEATGWSLDECEHVFSSLALAMIAQVDRLDAYLTDAPDLPARTVLAAASQHAREVLDSQVDASPR